MAALSVADRTRIWRGAMRFWSAKLEVTPNITKFDIYNPNTDTGAVADMDNWFDTHGGNVAPDTIGFNGALSTIIKTNLTIQQKLLLAIAVECMRYGDVDLLRRILGEVD